MTDYRLDDLGWYQFERLCQALLYDECGLAVEAWGGSSDGGRDAYADGPLAFPRGSEPQDGPFVFQVKFVQEARAAGAKPAPALKQAVRAELVRIEERRAADGWWEPRRYVLLTNVALTRELRESIAATLSEDLPESTVKLVGAADLEAMLDGAEAVRQAYPQLLGLRDLRALLRQEVARDVVTRSEFAVELGLELLPVFVPTEAYSEALDVLDEHGFVVLTGPPEMGKTAIARTIGLTRLTAGWDVIECRRPKDLFKVYAADRRQLFIADDAFGSTEYRPDVAEDWAADLDRIIRRLDSAHWLIWTSRPAPLRKGLAMLHMQGAAERFPGAAELQVDASRLSETEKALILYRHSKVAGLSDQERQFVRRFAREIVRNRHFTPERIRRFVGERLPELTLDADWSDGLKAIEAELEQPTVSMRKSFAALSADEKTMLVAMLDVPEGSLTPERLGAGYRRHADDGQRHPPAELTQRLEQHFICLVVPIFGSGEVYQWVHPSWRDLVIDHLASDERQRRRFLSSTDVPGALLALSTEGGAAGGRRLPLLRDEDDWALLGRRLTEIVLTSEEPHIGALLVTLYAIDDDDPAAGLVADLVPPVLAATRQRWANVDEAISMGELRAYYRLSLRARPIPASPDLDRTWDAYAELPRGERLSLPEADRWLDLVTTLARYEPRFLEQRGFPETSRTELEAIVEELRTSADALRDLVAEPPAEEGEEEDEEAFELERIELLPRIAHLLARVEGFEHVDSLAAELEEYQRAHERRRQEELSEAMSELEEDGRPPWEGEAEFFEIELIFEDL